MRTLLALSILTLAGCSQAPGEYCDTPGVCTLPDGMVPDAKADAADASKDAADGAPDAGGG